MDLSKVSSSQIDIIEKNADYLSFYIKNNFVLSKIIGEFDSNLKEIESLTNTKINLRGNLMIVKGNSDNRQSVVQILDNLISKFFLIDKDNNAAYWNNWLPSPPLREISIIGLLTISFVQGCVIQNRANLVRNYLFLTVYLEGQSFG